MHASCSTSYDPFDSFVWWTILSRALMFWESDGIWAFPPVIGIVWGFEYLKDHRDTLIGFYRPQFSLSSSTLALTSLRSEVYHNYGTVYLTLTVTNFACITVILQASFIVRPLRPSRNYCVNQIRLSIGSFVMGVAMTTLPLSPSLIPLGFYRVCHKEYI